MNGRKLFREYAQSKGHDAKEFVEIKQEFYAQDTLVTKDNYDRLETLTIDYREMVHWIIKNKKNNGQI
jgi:hypothetical protein